LTRARLRIATMVIASLFAAPMTARGQLPIQDDGAVAGTAADPYRNAVIREDAGYPPESLAPVGDLPVARFTGGTGIEAGSVTLIPGRAIGWPHAIHDPAITPDPAHEVGIKHAEEAQDPDETRKPVASRQFEDLWDRIRAGFAMPDLESHLVVSRQNQIANHPQLIKLLVERSRRYLFHIVEEIEKRGMPTELALLPMVESAFDPMAYSRAHASGLWQFIPSTGRNFNLEQNWWYDARRDIVASTQAALEYLQKIHEMHGDWHLALASYNFGEWGVARAVERNRRMGLAADYSSIPLPNETRHYVPRLQALKNIIANPARFGIELDPIPNEPYFATMTLTRDIDLHIAARLADMPLEELIALNPGHNRPVVSTSKAPTLVLPANRLDLFMSRLEAYDKPLSTWRVYSAQRGERIEEIAAKHGVTVDSLRQVNGVRGSGRLQADAQLLLPTRHTESQALPGTAGKGAPTIAAELPVRIVRHLVKAGETWDAIARRYRVNPADLQAWNGSKPLMAGSAITIQAPGAPTPRTNANRSPARPKASVTPTKAKPAPTATRKP